MERLSARSEIRERQKMLSFRFELWNLKFRVNNLLNA